MSKAEAFRRTCDRNAIRRDGKLPLIDIHEGVDEELRRDALIAYGLASDHYHDEYLRIRQQVLEGFRAERGPDFGISTGGRWLIDYFAGRRFRAFLAGKGFIRPASGGVRYGAGRKS